MSRTIARCEPHSNCRHLLCTSGSSADAVPGRRPHVRQRGMTRPHVPFCSSPACRSRTCSRVASSRVRTCGPTPLARPAFGCTSSASSSMSCARTATGARSVRCESARLSRRRTSCLTRILLGSRQWSTDCAVCDPPPRVRSQCPGHRSRGRRPHRPTVSSTRPTVQCCATGPRAFTDKRSSSRNVPQDQSRPRTARITLRGIQRRCGLSTSPQSVSAQLSEEILDRSPHGPDVRTTPSSPSSGPARAAPLVVVPERVEAVVEGDARLGSGTPPGCGRAGSRCGARLARVRRTRQHRDVQVLTPEILDEGRRVGASVVPNRTPDACAPRPHERRARCGGSDRRSARSRRRACAV